MKAKLFLFILMQAFWSTNMHAQTLTGIVRLNGQPVSGVSVYTSFATDKTDGNGRYAILLKDCSSCKPGATVNVYTFEKSIGSSQTNCVIPNNYNVDLTIAPNARLNIYGQVINSLTGEGIPDVEVKIMADIDMDPVKTNSYGQFTMPVRVVQMINPSMNAVMLLAKDPSKRWRPVRSDPELFQISSFVKIKMEPSESRKISISGHSRTQICFRADDIITIEASGQMTVGMFVGTSTPDGREFGPGGFSLAAYNLVKEFNHAALMYRTAGESDWRLAGRRRRFIANRTGCLEFQINDNTQDDNSGVYEVEVTIQASQD